MNKQKGGEAMERPTDEELVARIRQGHDDAYRALVERHQNYIFTLIYRQVEHRETAEDLMQEVFIKLYRSLFHFRGDAKFTTWLYRLTLNLVADYRRARKRRPLESLLDVVREWFSDEREQPEQMSLHREERDAVQRIVAELPEKYRLIVGLYHFQQLSYREIAQITGLPVKTVETRLYRGKAMLKQKWLEVNGNVDEAPERSAAATVSE
ncbi:RNA polymerase sigma factor [Paenibacillus hamazuiensis]|uniref:RNA polymerase sigma factor n=1 Tax=Paenibacillus hamazuiensis TaxID=2936508 RepID=UPI0020106207|nr:sigma-70 family RNA polymerase sigma factor [Paenibacillus hamazuiensis]